jgi:hypothetical protein
MHTEIAFQTVEASGLGFPIPGAGPEPACRVALAVVEAVLRRTVLRVRDDLELLRLEVQPGNAVTYTQHNPSGSPWDHRVHVLPDVDRSVVPADRVIDVKLALEYVSPVEDLASGIPQDALSRIGFGIEG